MRLPKSPWLFGLLVTLVLLAVSASSVMFYPSFSGARTKVFPDKKSPHQASTLDLTKIVVTQRGRLMKFAVVFGHPMRVRARARGTRTQVLIKAGKYEYYIRDRLIERIRPLTTTRARGKIIGRSRLKLGRKMFIHSFRLGAIGSPAKFKWNAEAHAKSHAFIFDSIPGSPRFFANWTTRSRKPEPKPIPKRVIRFSGGKGVFPVDCYGKRKTCRGTVTIQNGDKDLVNPKRYTVAPGKKKALVLRLTKTGKKLLAKRNTFKAQGTLTSAQGAKLKFIAILRKK